MITNKLQQKGRTNYYSLMLLSFLVVAIFFIPNASSAEFDNTDDKLTERIKG